MTGIIIQPSSVSSGDMLAANNLSDVASAATSRTNLGLGTSDSPQFAGVNLGHASDTTVARASAGVVSVEGNHVPSPASQAQGDVLYHNGTTWARLAAGTSGHFLKTNGAGSNPAWAAAGTISTPKVYYVESDGNNGTAEVGNPAKPFATLQAAYDAGVTAAVHFVIQVGVGSFTLLTNGDPLDGNFFGISGRGYVLLNSDADSPSRVSINTSLGNATNTDGADGPANPPLYATGCFLSLTAEGQSVNMNDEIGGYTGGDGGSIEVFGDAVWSLSARGGGTTSSTTEGGTGGAPGTISIKGGHLFAAYCCDGDGGSTTIPVPSSIPGAVTMDGVNASAATFGSVPPTITAGRCSFATGVTIGTDKGGNATGW